MVLTVLEARVPAERAETLRKGYESLAKRALPPGLVSSRLIRASTDAELWRLETVWQDRRALEAMRGQGTPAGLLLFREAGVEPTVALFEVVATIAPTGR
jgi:hypothetical protein